MTGKAGIRGLCKWDGREWIIWMDSQGMLHVTDGILDETDKREVGEYMTVLTRVVAIDRMAMMEKLMKYQPDSELLRMLKGGR